MKRRVLPILGLLLILPLVAAGPLAAQQSASSLSVSGDIPNPLKLSASDLAQMPRATVSTNNGGIETRYEGVWLHEILKRAGVPLGEALRGKALATYVLAQAQDGYQVLFSVGELDPAFADNQILVADSANGKPLFGDDGAFRIVTPREKRGARSVRMLIRLDVVQVRK